MNIIFPGLIELLLVGLLLLGLVLFVVGIVLIFRLKNKLVGALITAAGAGLAVLPALIFLGYMITTSRVVG